ncbi:acyl carrier protein [Butyrivibrio sp. NC3005]|jgi:acyl carrier protein|uniref:acyl carrier protein n=1 Tax=Butyrivibrio sp. NC3005 TaxID=1280685 RepID=UPI00041E339E|nr:phosphopantetheine-binding protein [Butyrivibrio sp. NC3005]
MDAKRQELMDEISEFLRSHTENDLGDFDEDSQLLADLGFNSLDFLTIINDAEVEFDIVIEDEDLEDIVTVGDVVDLVMNKMEN